MSKTILLVLVMAFIALNTHAQTKIIKEVDGEISSQMKIIRQDNTLVGYLTFTRLEKVTEDSFNYKITIMDENLNDIGTLNFREINLQLHDVSFTNDVLCLGYYKSNFDGNIYKRQKDFDAAVATMQNEVLMQFVSLDGKILKTTSINADVTPRIGEKGQFDRRGPSSALLEHKILLQNIEQKGFALFYGDKNNCHLLLFNTKGDILWHKKINKPQGLWFSMLSSGRDIYLLLKSTYGEGGYELLGYSTKDSTAEMYYTLVDEHANQLKVLAFENDPATGQPYVAGLVMNPKRQLEYTGLYTINVNGVDNKAIDAKYTYWNQGALDSTTDTREFEKQIKDTKINFAFKDFNGLTYFTGANHFNGAELIKQNSKATLTIETNVLDEKIRVYRPGPGAPKFGDDFYRVINTEKKADYLVADTDPVITIYDVTGKKIVHSIPHKDAGIITNVAPAKEGYIMIAEYNKKGKYTKFSIEAL